MRCLRCDGSGFERKKPNLPRKPCYWCEGTGKEPDDISESLWADVNRKFCELFRDGYTTR